MVRVVDVVSFFFFFPSFTIYLLVFLIIYFLYTKHQTETDPESEKLRASNSNIQLKLILVYFNSDLNVLFSLQCLKLQVYCQLTHEVTFITSLNSNSKTCYQQNLSCSKSGNNKFLDRVILK